MLFFTSRQQGKVLTTDGKYDNLSTLNAKKGSFGFRNLSESVRLVRGRKIWSQLSPRS